jgi:hypothetical protein
MRRLRRHHPDRRWVTSSLQPLCQYERRTRLNELVHLLGFIGCTDLSRVSSPWVRLLYVRKVTRAVKPGGNVIVSTFGPEGPTKCSGLEVVRYDAASLHQEFGVHFRLLDSCKEMHRTPFGTVQQFLYCLCRIE